MSDGEVEKRFVRNTIVTVQIKWNSFFRKIKDEKNTVSLAHPSYCGGLSSAWPLNGSQANRMKIVLGEMHERIDFSGWIKSEGRHVVVDVARKNETRETRAFREKGRIKKSGR